jgi:hypothetical protein
MKEKNSINVLLFKESIKGTDIEKWVAQGLERDITGQGDTPTEALKSFEHVITGHIILDIENGRKPLSNIPPVPQLL